MATATQARDVFAKIDELLVLQHQRIELIRLRGRLNAEQARNLAFALTVTNELRALFQREAVRQGVS
jgi:hypothetical protein